MILTSYFLSFFIKSISIFQAREEFRFAKYKKQVNIAIVIIERSYIAWKRRHYLLTLPIRFHATSMSPMCSEWPTAPKFLLEASQLLKNIFHKWRVSENKLIFNNYSLTCKKNIYLVF